METASPFCAAASARSIARRRGRPPLVAVARSRGRLSRRAGVHVGAQEGGPGHGDRQWLGAAHPPQTPGHERAGPGGSRRDPNSRPAALGEGLVRPLEDPLRPDVDPRAGCHLAVHREAERLQPGGTRPTSPSSGHEVAVREQHPGRVRVGPEDGDRLPGLDEERLVVAAHPPARARSPRAAQVRAALPDPP